MNTFVELLSIHRNGEITEYRYRAKRHANVCTFVKVPGLHPLLNVEGSPRSFSALMTRQRDGGYELRYGVADKLPTIVGNIANIGPNT